MIKNNQNLSIKELKKNFKDSILGLINEEEEIILNKKLLL